MGCGTGPIGEDGYCERCGLRQPAQRDHSEIELPENAAAGVSDKGKRYSHNEDALAIASHSGGVAAVVCDGVGSSPRPDEASRAAADAAVAELVAQLESGADPEAAMHSAVRKAAEAVAALSEEPDAVPSCTFVSAVTTPGAVAIGWVGDSRAYWLPTPQATPETDPLDTQDLALPDAPLLNATPRALTTDDSWAAFMVAEGALTEAEAEAHPNAHVITGWLGADADEVRPHVHGLVPEAPGALLVCSDGLWNYLPAATDLAAVLAGASIDPVTAPLAAARALVRRALDEGGRDNITVAVIPLPHNPLTMEHKR